MTEVAGALAALRRDMPGCALVAYADLDARLVLASSSAEPQPREVLDALCRTAQKCLTGPAAIAAARALGLARLNEAASACSGRTALFLRGTGDLGDALFCVFDGPTDPAMIRPMARAVLARLERLA